MTMVGDFDLINMKNLQKIIAVLFTSILFFSSSCNTNNTISSEDINNLYKYVDPLIGTDFPGNAYPGATAPFGMVQLSPDNGREGWNYIGGYFYPDSVINGFSHTHLLGTGAGDMYDIRFMPALEPALVGDSIMDIYSHFDHESEDIDASHYAVTLKDYDIRVDLTADTHLGVQSYRFDRASDSAFIIVDLARRMNWDNTVDTEMIFESDSIISGYRFSNGWARNQKVFFHSEISRKPYKILVDSIPIKDAKGEKYAKKAKLYYNVKKGDEIVVLTALSGVSIDGAKRNFEAEAKHKFDFQAYRNDNIKRWNDKLSLAKIYSNDDIELKKYYTALFRTMQAPTTYSDVDGSYLAPNGEIKQYAKENVRYSTFSLWDTYRTAHPWYNIILPKESGDMARSLMDFGAENNGHLPVWNMWASETDMMIAYHSVPVIVDAIQKGIFTDYDKDKLKSIFLSTALRKNYRGLNYLNEMGYIPADREEESVSKTIEYSFDNYAISRWAKFVGDSSLYEEFSKKAKDFGNLFNKEIGFFAPKLSNGNWKKDFDPFVYSKDFTESNAFQYQFAVQNDFDYLISLFGSKKKMATALDNLFSKETPNYIELPIFSTGMIGQYVQGNEPSHHVAYLYNLVDMPYKTAEIVRKISNELYTEKPNGTSGNEDKGQMSAWFVMSSLGFYPLDPVSNQYELVTPRYQKSEIKISGNKNLIIECDKDPKEYQYIKAIKIDGREHKKSYITYDELLNASKIEISLSKEKGLWY